MYRSIKQISAISLCILASACSSTGVKNESASKQESVQYSNSEYGYVIEAPNNFEIGKHAIQGVIQGPGLFAQNGTDIDIYDPASPNPPTSCSPSLTGASQVEPLVNAKGKTEWGKVDFFEKYKGDGFIDYDGEPPLCAQPSKAKHRYALCSENNGKTVVICISQMTDNPQLAKEIFETFRWTK
jgi:hypothetical protein